MSQQKDIFDETDMKEVEKELIKLDEVDKGYHEYVKASDVIAKRTAFFNHPENAAVLFVFPDLAKFMCDRSLNAEKKLGEILKKTQKEK